MALTVVILAAGKGTRMKSRMPKVLHPVAGKSMLQHTIDAAKQLAAKNIVVVAGHGIELVKNSLVGQEVQITEQKEQLGTGHAVNQALPIIDDEDQVLVLYGDVPLIKVETLAKLCQQTPQKGLGLLTVKLDQPHGYGRIVRNEQQEVTAIVEQKDANQEQLLIDEVNTGILAANSADLKRWLSQVNNQNAQGEYYLTDTIAMAASEASVIACHPSSAMEVEGVNSRVQLAQLERAYQADQATMLMENGVTLIDPARIDIRGELDCATDVLIDVNVIIEGKVSIDSNTVIGANCILKNCSIGPGSLIKPNSIIESAEIGEQCEVGPFARIRPGTKLAKGAFIGNFVETKNATIGLASKASHLSYIGDAVVGDNVNIGAGVITCNYDGANKFVTNINDNAFIGSDSQLVAPVTIGKGATIGAGTTVTKDVPDENLCISRVSQRHIDDWERPIKKVKKEENS